jgi:hypothetical protein
MLRTFIIALVTGFLASVGAQGAPAQQLSYFYCFVPDAESGTVFMSQTLPAGPVNERAGYGAAFAAYLRDTGKINNVSQAYFVMRSSAAEVDKSRSVLSEETCSVCGDAKQFVTTAWPRNGAPALAKDVVKIVKAAVSHPPTTPPLAPGGQVPYLVAMGNEETGEIIIGRDELKEVTAARAHAMRSTGWSTLAVTHASGFGAALCVEHKGKTHFFVTYDKDSRGEAIQDAWRKAVVYARKVDGQASRCSQWRAGPAEQVKAAEPPDFWDELLLAFIPRCDDPVGCNDINRFSGSKTRFATFGIRN